MRLFLFLYAILLFACTYKKETQTVEFKPEHTIAPKTVLASQPKITVIDTCPYPKTTFLVNNTGPVNFKSVVKKRVKQLPPEVKAANYLANMKTFNMQQGLALNSVLSSFMDKAGNLWFGCDGNGVSKYDGKSFTNYSFEHGLGDSQVSSIIEDNNGNIWFGGLNGGALNGGVSKYDGKSFMRFGSKDGLIGNIIYCIYKDKIGNLWFGTQNGVSKYNGQSFTSITTADGLINNKVTGILEDRYGNLWFGTDGGGVSIYHKNSMNRRFTHFTTADGLANNNVTCIAEDKTGNIWIGTKGNGASKCNGNLAKITEHISDSILHIPSGIKNGKEKINLFTNYSIKDGLTNNTVLTIMVDQSGNIWFGTLGGGASKYNGKTFTNFTTAEGLANNTVCCITADKTGNLWFGTISGGLSKYDGKYITSFTTAQGLTSNSVFSIAEDRAGNVWFGTYSGGVSKYDGNRVESIERSSIIPTAELKNLKKVNGKLIKTFTNFTTVQGLANNIVYSIIEDRKGNMWFGTDGGGVSKYDGNSFTNYTTAQGLASNIIYCILEDKKGNIWFGTDSGVTKYDGNRLAAIGPAGNAVTNNPDSKKLNAKLVPSFTNYTIAQGLPSNFIGCIYEDAKGDIWFGTHKGICKYNGNTVGSIDNDLTLSEKNKLTNLNKLYPSFTVYAMPQGLVNNIVYSVGADTKGNLWLGTDGGISRFDGSCFTNYTVENGLVSDQVFGIVEDNLTNTIWCGTNKGLSALKFTTDINGDEKVAVENYNPFNGYSFEGITNPGAFYKDRKQIIWAGTGSKLIRFDCHDLNKSNEAPLLAIKSIKINNENVCWNDLLYNRDRKRDPANDTVSNLNAACVLEEVSLFGKSLNKAERDTIFKKFEKITFDSISRYYPIPQNLALPFDNNKITFDFAGIETSRPSIIRYQYILEGYDKDWSPITDLTTVTFSNMQEANYTFKLKARSPDGIWSQPLSYSFVVLPPWYRTWWALTIYLITLGGLIVSLIHWRTALLKKDKELLEQTVRERTIEIVVQKNEAEKQRKVAEKLARVKEEFLSNMSHEIRTPLNAVIGYTDVSLQELSLDKVKKNLQAVKLSSNHLKKLVDDILDYSKIESGKFNFNKTTFDLVQTLEEIKLLLHFQAIKNGNELHVSISDTVPIFIYGDKERLMQVLINIIDNAIKFTTNGKINVNVNLIKKDNEKIEVAFAINDTGIGIPAQKLEKIFESFTQGNNDISRKYGGTGLGLTISKRIIELQDGQIKVASSLGKGTQFLIILPYKLGEKQLSVSNEQLPCLNTVLPALNLLAAEDDPVNQDLLSQILKNMNITVDFAETGEKLISLLENNTYHLIVLDIHLPGMTGFEIAQTIRTKFSAPVKDIPIIALTADVLPRTRNKIMASGINDYMYKPIDYKLLHAKINFLLNLESTLPKNSIENEWKVPTQYLNLNLLVDNYGTNKEAIFKILNKSDQMLNEYNSSLVFACQNKNYEEVLFVAHKLVSIAGVLGIDAIQRNIIKIQESVTLGASHECIFAAIDAVNYDSEKASSEIKNIMEYLYKN